MVLTHSNVLYICIGIIQVVSSYAVKGEVPRSLLLLDRLHVNCLALFSRHLLVTLLKAGNFLFLVFVNTLHVLHHLTVAGSDHVLVTFGHHVLIVSLLLLERPFALFEERPVQLKII